jgi:hypothetical protein
VSEPTATLDHSIAAFAAAVRRHLDDLPLEEVDDLTGGLEADLSEQASDEGGNISLDDPTAYAAELRASAGLPPRGEAAVSLGQRVARGFHSLGVEARRLTRSTRLGSWLADITVSLRPVWWVMRGWVVYQLLTIVFQGHSALVPSDLTLWVLLIAVLVLSVQWGRGKWAPGRVIKGIRTIVSVVAIVTLPLFAWWALNESNEAATDDSSAFSSDLPGLWLDGQRVTNIFGYDADGNPITKLQLFDQNGDPLVTVGDPFVDDDYDFTHDGTTATVPFEGSSSGTGWNIYPLNEAPLSDRGDADPRDAVPATPPFRTAQPLSELPTPTPTPTPTSTPEPTSTPSGAQ